MNYNNTNLIDIGQDRGDPKRLRTSERNQGYEYHFSKRGGQSNPYSYPQASVIDTKVQANFFKLISLPKEVYHYDVSITPDTNIDINHGIVKMIKGNRDEILTQYCVYDGRKALFSPCKLEFEDIMDFKVEYNVPGKRRSIPEEFSITLKEVNLIDFSALEKDITYKAKLSNFSMTALMALDIIIRYKSSIKNTVYGRSFFSSDDNKKISNGIELWRGYYQACKATESGVYINVDTTATAFYQSGSLIDVITSFVARRSREELRSLNDYSKNKIKSFIKGLYITTSHRGPLRKFRIKELSQDSASNTKFKVNGELKTILSYFRDTYNIHLYFDFLPCVIVGKDVYLPIELCNVIPGQKYPRKLNELQTSDMIKFTCLNPCIRSNKIRNAIDIMNYNNNEYLKAFDIKIGREFIDMPSKLLPPPSLTYRSPYNQSESNIIPSNGVWRISENLLFTNPIKSVSVISFCPHDLDEIAISNFFKDLFRVCRRMGMKFQLNSPFISTSNPHGNIKNELILSTRNAYKKFGASPDIIFAILPNSNAHLYNQIKTFSDNDLGIPTQCIQSRHVINGRGNRQYCTNIAYKLNAKTGGINTELLRSDIKIISSLPTMIIGIDLNLPFKVESRNQSIVTLVASQNETASKYRTYVEYQSDKLLVVKDIKRISVKIFSDFNKLENYIPNRVIVYRDGVSDGQFDQTMDYEVSRIHQGFSQVFPNEALNITYIVVQKRHHIKFFPMNVSHRDESGNCSPGTIVSSVITEPGRLEFFLQSHSGIKGTSRSAHYYILLDENRFEIDDIQKLSYYLCYTNARCTRSVSLVPPVSYANLMSTRAKCYDQVNFYGSDYEDTERGNIESLSNILYYI